MTYKSVALNSFTPSSNPTIVDGVLIDGYVDGKPVLLRKMRDGMLMPAIGTVVSMSYGTGIVTGYSDDMLVVDVVEPNEDFEFETKDVENPDILDVHEYIASLNRCYRRSIESVHSDFIRLYKSEITGRLSERNEQRMRQAFQHFDDNEVVVGGSIKPFEPTDMVVARIIGIARETPSERKARIKREQAMATKMANAMLMTQQEDEIPADVLAEMSAVFGD